MDRRTLLRGLLALPFAPLVAKLLPKRAHNSWKEQWRDIWLVNWGRPLGPMRAHRYPQMTYAIWRDSISTAFDTPERKWFKLGSA